MQKPSKDLFVVHAKRDLGKLQKILKELGEVEELKGGENLLLLHFRHKAAAAKSAWESIREKLREGDVVHPVLLDETGHHLYPTGEINVRFESIPSDAQLKKFAASHGMRLSSRNEYVPQQAIFELLNAGAQYVPELVQEISADENIKQAWANTLSRYERVKNSRQLSS